MVVVVMAIMAVAVVMVTMVVMAVRIGILDCSEQTVVSDGSRQ